MRVVAGREAQEGPGKVNSQVQYTHHARILTPSSSRPSRRWRGTTVTVSISARKAISVGVMPRGRGKAIGASRQREKIRNREVANSSRKCRQSPMSGAFLNMRRLDARIAPRRLPNAVFGVFAPELTHLSSSYVFLEQCSSFSSDKMGSGPESNLSRAARYAVPFVLVLIPVWRAKVNSEVPEPYLDEVFHIPQAQAYWAHRWTHWDPKLTTPPGLYLWSYLLCAVLLALRGSPTKLDTEALRTTNVATTAVFLPWRLQTLSDAVHNVRNTRQLGAWLSHTVLNICMFPPLFFFSGLYYTDILALLAVVEAYNWDLKRTSGKGYRVLYTLGFLIFGLAALVCRQTNIFWVAVFLGGLQVVRQIRTSSKTCEPSEVSSIVKRGLQGEVYDPLVSDASLSGMWFSRCAGQYNANLMQIISRPPSPLPSRVLRTPSRFLDLSFPISSSLGPLVHLFSGTTVSSWVSSLLKLLASRDSQTDMFSWTRTQRVSYCRSAPRSDALRLALLRFLLLADPDHSRAQCSPASDHAAQVFELWLP